MNVPIPKINSDQEELCGWRPTPVDQYRIALHGTNLSNMPDEFRSNIAYNLQYLEYLELQINKFDLHNVIKKLTCKTYIITAIAILECVFYHILKSNNKLKPTNWKKLSKDKVICEYNDNDAKKRVVYSTEEWSDTPIEKRLYFDKLLNLVFSGKYLSISISDEDKDRIKRLKNLRNKIHLYYANWRKDTDFFNFIGDECLYMKAFLFLVLSDNTIQTSNRNIFTTLYEKAIDDLNFYEYYSKYV